MKPMYISWISTVEGTRYRLGEDVALGKIKQILSFKDEFRYIVIVAEHGQMEFPLHAIRIVAYMPKDEKDE